MTVKHQNSLSGFSPSPSYCAPIPPATPPKAESMDGQGPVSFVQFQPLQNIQRTTWLCAIPWAKTLCLIGTHEKLHIISKAQVLGIDTRASRHCAKPRLCKHGDSPELKWYSNSPPEHPKSVMRCDSVNRARLFQFERNVT